MVRPSNENSKANSPATNSSTDKAVIMKKENVNKNLNAAEQVSDENPDVFSDQQWQSLTSDWQAQPVSETDIPALLKETKRRTLWAKGMLVNDVLATVAVLIGFIYTFFMPEPDGYLQAYLGIAGFASAIYTYLAIKVRTTSWRNMCDSPENAISNAIDGCISSIKYIQLIKWSLYSLIPLGNWFIYMVAVEREKSPLWGLTLMNIVMVIMLVICQYFKRKRCKELEQLQSINVV